MMQRRFGSLKQSVTFLSREDESVEFLEMSTLKNDMLLPESGELIWCTLRLCSATS